MNGRRKLEVENNLTLQEKIELRSTQLQRSERLAFLGERMAEVVHNLRNPLTVIMGNVYRLQSNNNLLQEHGVKEVQAIARNAERMNEIIKTILLVSRENIDSEMQRFNLGKVLTSELDILRTDFQFRESVNIQIDIDEDLFLYGVVGHFSQIFGNILINAVHSMIDCPTSILTVNAYSDCQNISVEISDTGKGISKDNLGKIFDPFFTTKPLSTNGASGPFGTGLGMCFVKNMVSFYHGLVEVDSVEGQGTIVKIVFPIPNKEINTSIL